MPTETLNRTEDLINKIGYTDDTVDEADLQTVLEVAHQQMQSRVGKNFIETKRVKKEVESGDLVNELDLNFGPIFEVDEILVNQHEVLEDSNYTVDKESGVVTIDQSYVEDDLYLGQILRIEYKPQIFKQIELWRAVEIFKNQEIVELEDSEQVALNKNALREAKRLENMVNKRSGSGKATDGRVRRGTP